MSRAIAAELFKLRTTRTSWGVTLGALGLIVAITLIGSLAGDYEGSATPGPDLLQIAGLVQIFALVLGILVVATEFRHGTITPSLLAVPDRIELVAAKLVAALVVGLVLGLVAGALCAGIALPVLSARGYEAGFESGEALRITLGNAAATALWTALGVGLGALVRNQVGAIVGALGWLLVAQPLLAIIPGFGDVITKWFPTGAADQLSFTSHADDRLGQLPAGLLFAGYAALFVVAGAAMMRRRDVSA